MLSGGKFAGDTFAERLALSAGGDMRRWQLAGSLGNPRGAAGLHHLTEL
jgi:hypothetical protein